jgi:D-serine deaminase-like pyridoxal phosphate-dependent protein
LVIDVASGKFGCIADDARHALSVRPGKARGLTFAGYCATVGG